MEASKKKLLSRRRIINNGFISDCWEFTGYINPKGYGYMRPGDNSAPVRVHILSYMIFVGNYNNKLNVNHKCHIRKCFNPEHLYQGTQAENVRDSIIRGTHKNPLIAWNHTEKNKGYNNRLIVKKVTYDSNIKFPRNDATSSKEKVTK